MRQLTLGVQLKERATFASFLTARNAELVTHLRARRRDHAARRHLDRGSAHRRQIPPAAGGLRRGRGPAARAAYLPLETLLPFGPGTLDGAEALDVACYDDVQVDRRPGRMGANGCSRCGSARWNAAPRCCSRRARIPAHVDFGLAGPEVAPGVVGDIRGARAQRRGAACRRWTCARSCAASSCRPRPRVTCSDGFRATCARLCEILDTLDDAAFVAQRRLTVPFIRAHLDRPG